MKALRCSCSAGRTVALVHCEVWRSIWPKNRLARPLINRCDNHSPWCHRWSLRNEGYRVGFRGAERCASMEMLEEEPRSDKIAQDINLRKFKRKA